MTVSDVRGQLTRLSSGCAAIGAQGPQGSQLGSLTDADSVAFSTPGSVGLTAAAQSVDEGAGSATVLIGRAGGDGIVNVRYATANGTAAAGADYESVAGSVTFQQGETAKAVAIPIANDTATESAETLTLTLTRSAGGYVLATAAQTITINASDTASPPPPPPAAIPRVPAGRLRVTAKFLGNDCVRPKTSRVVTVRAG